MTAPRTHWHLLVAPARLVVDGRDEFRRRALEAVAEAAELGRSISVDLRETAEIDASGMGVLVLVHKRAKDRGLSTRLLRPREPVRRLLQLAHLDHLFDIVT